MKTIFASSRTLDNFRSTFRIGASLTIGCCSVIGLSGLFTTPTVKAASGRVIAHPVQASNVALQLSSYSVDATAVSYSLTFVSPDTLTNNHSTVAITAPKGTIFPKTPCLYSVTDDSSGQSNGCNTVSLPGTGTGKQKAANAVVIIAGVSVSAGGAVTVVVRDVTNPGTVAKTTVQVSTSSDPKSIDVPVTYVKETGVSAATWTSQRVTGSSLVTQLISFVSTSGLSGSDSSIVAAGPFAYSAPSGNAYILADDTTGQSYHGVSVTLSDHNQEVTVPTPFRFNAGDEVTLLVQGVGRSKSDSLAPTEVRTTSDPLFVRQSRDTPAVAPPHLVVGSTVAGATNVTYALSFGVPGAIKSGKQSITLSMPNGTVLPKPGCADYVVSDPEMGISDGCPTVTQEKGASARVQIPLTVAAGEVITISIPSVRNTTTTGKLQVTMHDSGAPGGWDDTVRPSAGLNGSLPLTLSSDANGTLVAASASSHSAAATEVTYNLTFVASHALLHGVGVFDVQTPTQFGVPNGSCASGFGIANDTLASRNECPAVTQQKGFRGTTSDILAPLDVEPADVVTVTITGVSNPEKAGTYTWNFHTSADPKPIAVKFTIVAATGVT